MPKLVLFHKTDTFFCYTDTVYLPQNALRQEKGCVILLGLKGITKNYLTGDTQVQALKGVDIMFRANEFVAVLGPSGCGKTTLLNIIGGLDRYTEGDLTISGKSTKQYKDKDWDFYRNHTIGFVFQTYNLIPHQTVLANVELALTLSGISKAERRERARKMLERVGLNQEHAGRYAHEFSGGQRQRVGIARALILRPELVICDEPISALDVSIQAQVVNMLRSFQEELNLTYLFIAHDLSMVRYVSDEVGVMYLGQLVEKCPANEIYAHPLHPYTVGLLSSIPVPNPRLARKKESSGLEGDLPSPIDPPSGCRFHTRCPYADDRCRQETPVWREAASGHFAACHRVNG